jgi:organic radical activating enzyme
MKINEIFYSLQGEGHYTGTPAVFIRFAGCNLKCSFCDTDFTSFTEMTEDDIVKETEQYPTRHIVITGGEPTLQITPSFIAKLHKAGKYVQIETNGTNALPEGCDIDWVTCSPKYKAVKLQHIDELKVVYEGEGQDMSQYASLKASEYRLQPCDTQDEEKNKEILRQTIDFILKNPIWKLSLQTHKILNVR